MAGGYSLICCGHGMASAGEKCAARSATIFNLSSGSGLRLFASVFSVPPLLILCAEADERRRFMFCLIGI
jgi:hypothetical protein